MLKLSKRYLQSVKKVRITRNNLLHLLTVIIVAIGLMETFIFPKTAKAISASGYVRIDRLASSATGTATGGGLVCTTPQTAGTEGKVVITFPGNGTQGANSFGVNSTASNWTLGTANIPSGTTAWPGIGTNPTGISGAAVTVASGDLTTGTTYCFTFVGASTLSNPTSASSSTLTGSTQTQTSGGSAIDTINWGTYIISNDQITVNATIPSTFTFALSSNTANLGSLPTSGAPNTSSAITVSVSTNAQNGWLAWVKNTNANSALVSTATSDGVCFGGNYPTCTGAAYQTGSGNVHSLSGAAGYGLSAATGTGTPTISTEYAGSASSFGSLDNTKFEQFASKNAPANGNTVSLTFGAEASTINRAASDYADTVTVTGAGQF